MLATASRSIPSPRQFAPQRQSLAVAGLRELHPHEVGLGKGVDRFPERVPGQERRSGMVLEHLQEGGELRPAVVAEERVEVLPVQRRALQVGLAIDQPDVLEEFLFGSRGQPSAVDHQ